MMPTKPKHYVRFWLMSSFAFRKKLNFHKWGS